MAMITAILVSVVVLFLGFVATGLSDHSFSSTRVEQKRVTTFHAAEAGVDHALRVLQTTSPVSSLPCAVPLARSLGGGAYAPDYVVTFTYYSVYPIAGAAMACPLAAEPAAVVLQATGGSSDPLGPARVVEAVVRLSVPTGLGAFPRTVFSDLSIDYDGPVALDGDVYTNGSIACDHGAMSNATLVAQGAVALSNGCSLLTGSVFANGAVSLAGNVQVGGDVVSSTSTVSVTSSSAVFGTAVAGGGVTPVPDGTSSIGFATASAPLPAPTASAFPTVTYNAFAWTTAGYSTQSPGCGTLLSSLATGWATPTVVDVSGCSVAVPATTTIALRNHVVLVASAGFDLGASVTFELAPSAPAGTRLTMLVPYGSSCSGTAGRIVMGPAVSFAVPLQVFAYTPCLLQAQTLGTMSGQLYGGTVRFVGPTTIAHASVGSIPGYVPVSLNVARAVQVVSAPREVRP